MLPCQMAGNIIWAIELLSHKFLTVSIFNIELHNLLAAPFPSRVSSANVPGSARVKDKGSLSSHDLRISERSQPSLISYFVNIRKDPFTYRNDACEHSHLLFGRNGRRRCSVFQVCNRGGGPHARPTPRKVPHGRLRSEHTPFPVGSTPGFMRRGLAECMGNSSSRLLIISAQC